MMKLSKLVSFAVALPIVVGLAACGPSEAPPPPPPPAIEYTEVIMAPVSSIREFVGRTRAREDTDIRAQVSGTILERNFEEGQFVDQDALLYRIDARQYEAALQSAKASLADALAALDVASRNLERGKELQPDGYISQSELDQLTADKNRAIASESAARASIETAQVDLGFTEIRAPFAGSTGRSNVSIGDLVNSSTGPLVSLVQRDPMLVDFDVDEQLMAEAMRENAKRLSENLEPIHYSIDLKLVNGDIYQHPGQIDYTNNRINSTTGTISVTAHFPNPESSLIPGQFARLLVKRGEDKMQMLIPQPSVLSDMQGNYVFVVGDDNIVKRKNVTLGPRHEISWVVEEGLAEGDKVVVNGIQKIRSNMPVTPSPVESLPTDFSQ